MSTHDSKTGASTLRALQMMEILAGYAANGATNKELAEQLKCPPAYVSRTADVLVEGGWVRKGETGRFYPTAQFTRLTFRVLADFQRLEDRTLDLKRSMTSPH